jgi:hypothetical protein
VALIVATSWRFIYICQGKGLICFALSTAQFRKTKAPWILEYFTFVDPWVGSGVGGWLFSGWCAFYILKLVWGTSDGQVIYD